MEFVGTAAQSREMLARLGDGVRFDETFVAEPSRVDERAVEEPLLAARDALLEARTRRDMGFRSEANQRRARSSAMMAAAVSSIERRVTSITGQS